MLIEARVLVRGDHPSLADHFPGKPIVPGAILLSEALAAGLRAGLPTIREIVVAKFTAPLGPDTPVLVLFDIRDDGKIRVTCRGETEGTAFLSAVLDCGNQTVVHPPFSEEA